MAWSAPFNLRNWVETNRELLKPPVGNKQIYIDNSDFIVMIVGGPNKRKDYHYNEGEELFYQLEGDIKLGLIDEAGKPQEITIQEGDMFLLPPRIPHCPRRGLGTVGLVLERYRKPGEKDGFMWFCEHCDNMLYNEFIYVNDIVAQLPVVMKAFLRTKVSELVRNVAPSCKNHNMDNNNRDIQALRKEYKLQGFDEKAAQSDPFKQFDSWFNEARVAQLPEPNAMHLATINNLNRPTGRIVLLKGFDEIGFYFYSNYHSAKGQQLEKHPFVALTFFWVDLERQVRIEGKVIKASPEVSDAYFASRPRESQIGAWASPQSQVIGNREFLDEQENRYYLEFERSIVPRPLHWGGYVLKPDYFEFWQGRPSRLHDRIVYSLERGIWIISRLAP